MAEYKREVIQPKQQPKIIIEQPKRSIFNASNINQNTNDDIMKIMFGGYEEILGVIDQNKEITESLGFPNEKCALINSTIKLVKQLGKGVSGVVYSIDFPGMGSKEYAVKKGSMNLLVGKNLYGNWLKYFHW